MENINMNEEVIDNQGVENLKKNDLSLFFPENIEQRQTSFFIAATDRIKDFDGEPLAWEFEYPKKKTYDEIKDAGQKREKRNGSVVMSYDASAMYVKAITECAKYPDLKNASLQDMHKAQSSADLLYKLLTPGEVDRLGQKVAIAIDLIDDPMEKLELAKN